MGGKLLVRILAACVIATFAFAPLVAAAPKKTTKKNTKTFSLKGGDRKTFMVPYPDALKFGNAKYGGSVAILKPAKLGKGQKAPDLKKVKVISKGSAVGGSDFSAKVNNANAKDTAPVQVRLTATTT